jgi:hypothetical protein
VAKVVGSRSQNDGFGGTLISGAWAACSGGFDLLDDVQHVTAVTSSVGVHGPFARRRGQPPWRGMRHDTDRHG